MVASSQRWGVGAVPYDGGVTFRTWAPFARAVAVGGTDSGWAEQVHDLAAEADGWWSVDVPAAQVGDRYTFLVTTVDGTLVERADPRARVVQSSIGHSVVYDGGAYDWRSDAFSIPAWNELVVYELHIGTSAHSPRPATVPGISSRPWRNWITCATSASTQSVCSLWPSSAVPGRRATTRCCVRG